MGSFSIWHWLLVLLIVVLVFGTRKLGNIGKDLGSAVRGFKEGMKEEEEEKPTQPPLPEKEVSGERVPDRHSKEQDRQ